MTRIFSNQSITLKNMNTPTPVNLSRNPQTERHITLPPPKSDLWPLPATRHPVSINFGLIQARQIQANVKSRGDDEGLKPDVMFGDSLVSFVSRAG